MSSDPLPTNAAIAAGTAPVLSRRRSRPGHERLLRLAVPYSLVAPATLVIAAVLGYPLFFLIKLSVQRYGLPELIAHRGVWVGVSNFRAILHDSLFWHVLLRTIVYSS